MIIIFVYWRLHQNYNLEETLDDEMYFRQGVYFILIA